MAHLPYSKESAHVFFIRMNGLVMYCLNKASVEGTDSLHYPCVNFLKAPVVLNKKA